MSETNKELEKAFLKSFRDMGIAFVGEQDAGKAAGNVWTTNGNPFGVGKAQPFKPGLGNGGSTAGPVTGINIHHGSLGNPALVQPAGLLVFFLFNLEEREQLPYVATGQIVFVQQPGIFFRCTVGSDLGGLGAYQSWTATGTGGSSKSQIQWEEVYVAVTTDNRLTAVPVIKKTAIDIKLTPQEQEKYEEFEKLLPTPIKLIEGSKNHSAQQTEQDSNYILSHDPFAYDGPDGSAFVYKKQTLNAISPG